MKIALIVRSGDARLADAHRDFHLSAGVDVIVQADGEAGGADWVIESELCEFWWPRGGSLKDVLATIPSRFGSVQAVARPFVPVGSDAGSFAERMIYRL